MIDLLKLQLQITSLPRSRFVDVTQRGALRDIQKRRVREPLVPSGISKWVLDILSFPQS